jgi:cytochrome P450
MTLHPEAQAEAHAEIDAILGPNRLPTLADQDDLPYVRALISEIMRFGLVVAQAPRVCGSDDFYRGFFIPKGSIILQNTWSVVGN